MHISALHSTKNALHIPGATFARMSNNGFPIPKTPLSIVGFIFSLNQSPPSSWPIADKYFTIAWVELDITHARIILLKKEKIEEKYYRRLKLHKCAFEKKVCIKKMHFGCDFELGHCANKKNSEWNKILNIWLVYVILKFWAQI